MSRLGGLGALQTAASVGKNEKGSFLKGGNGGCFRYLIIFVVMIGLVFLLLFLID
jgi:hypothetical protein